MRRYKTAKQLKPKQQFIQYTSNSERLFLDIMEAVYNIKIERQFSLNGKYYDGKLNNILIEIDGAKWHRSKKQKENDLLKEEIAKQNNYEIYRIKLNSIQEIPEAIHKNKELLNKIFK